MASQVVLETLGDAFHKVLEAQNLYMQQSYALAATGPVLDDYFHELVDGGLEAAGSWENLGKVFLPALSGFRDIGMAESEAVTEAQQVSQYFRLTGTNLTELVPKLDAGTASFHELLSAIKLLEPATANEIQNLARIAEQESAYAKRRQEAETELAHTHELERRQYQLDEEALTHRYELEKRARDEQDRLNAVRASFARTAGISGQVFGTMIQYPYPTSALPPEVPGELAVIPGMMKLWMQEAAETRARFQAGSEQLAKELGLPIAGVAMAENIRAPGFRESDVEAAAERARAAKELHADQAEADRQRESRLKEQSKEFAVQDQHYARQQEEVARLRSLEEERVGLNERIAQAIRTGGEDSQKTLDAVIALEKHSQTLAGVWETIGNTISGTAAKLSTMKFEDVTQPLPPSQGLGLFLGGGAELMNYLFGGAKSATGAPQGLATESGQTTIADRLSSIDDKLGRVFE